MIAHDLLAELDQRGITIEAHGGRLRYSPRSAVTPDLADRMKAHKGELLALLRPKTEAPNDQRFDDWIELRRPDGGLSWVHPDHVDDNLQAIDPPDPCATCSTLELWQTLVAALYENLAVLSGKL